MESGENYDWGSSSFFMEWLKFAEKNSSTGTCGVSISWRFNIQY